MTAPGPGALGAEAVPLFAALGDDVRFTLVRSLSDAGPQSIADLARRTPVSRQAVTKHLRVLESVGLASSRRAGRERIWELRPRRLGDAQRYLESISRQWDDALERLRAHVEDPS